MEQSAGSVHVTNLDDFVAKLVSTGKSSFISGDKFDAISSFLRNENTNVSPSFKHWVRKRKFEIKDLPALGIKDVLVCPAKAKKEVRSVTTAISNFNRKKIS